MRLTRQTEIAIDILVACAQSLDRVILTADAARSAHTSKDHAAHIVRLLLQSGFLFAERGRYGGIGLAIPAEEIPLGDVLRRIQPDLVRYSQNGDGDNGRWTGEVNPAFAAIATVAETTFLEIMNRYSVADLAANRKMKFSMKTSNKAIPLPCNVCELMHYAVSWVMPHGRGLVAFAPVFGHATVRHNQSASRNSEVLIKCRRSRSLAIRYAELSGRSRQQETVPSVAFPAADRVLILNGH